MMCDRVDNRDEKWRPVLVQGEHADHHEEVEVRLDLPAPEVDQHGRAGDQAKRGGDHSCLHPEALRARARPAQRDQAAVERDVDERVVPVQHPECEQRRHMEPEQHADRTVAATQHRLGQELSAGERVLKRCPVTCDPGGRASRAAAAGTVDMAARGCGGLGAKAFRDVGHRAHAVAWSLSAIWARWLGLRSAAVTGRTCSGFSATERGKPPGNSAGAGMGNVNEGVVHLPPASADRTAHSTVVDGSRALSVLGLTKGSARGPQSVKLSRSTGSERSAAPAATDKSGALRVQ